MEDRDALSAEQRWQFDSILRAYLHVCETMYTQAALGAVNISILTAEEAGIKFIFASLVFKLGGQEILSVSPLGFVTILIRSLKRKATPQCIKGRDRTSQ